MVADERIEFSCSICGKEIKEKRGRLEADDLMLCPHCGGDISSQIIKLTRALKRVDKNLANDLAKIRRGED